MHILAFTYKLNLIVILVNTYILFYAVRFFIPYNKKIIFNRLYRFIYKTTEPILKIFGKKKIAEKEDKKDIRALYVILIFITLYWLLFSVDNPSKPFLFGLIYMISSFVTYFFYLFSFMFIADFFILKRGPHSYGEFARIIHFASNSVIRFFRKIIPKISELKRIYKPFIGLGAIIVLSSFSMTILSGLLGDAVSFMENIGRALQSLINMFAFIWITLIILRVVFSWFRTSKKTLFYENLIFLTEPILSKLRTYIPPYKTGIDFTPIVAIVIILILEKISFFLINLIF
ncbi:MAG: YggT family protein [Candidatus Mcinerneyibacterium aminivorans]|uniref:YggT family protein n=1 Tax=Candidatus Mcinerneyibacterium aminivorans TaxID=2703815 RepID=A0A5D0MJN0_9BACT|nr:MAG: YggT family protein [Candidatus Mcinerneyibacterium aminivorans]